jgi:hypothetical protein
LSSDNGIEFGVFWGDSLRERVVTKEAIIENLLYLNDVVCLSADSGVGKSLLALQLLCNLTTGESFLGTYKTARPMCVLYVQTEGDRSETLERLEAMCAGMKLDDSKWVHINLSGISLNTPQGLKDFKHLALAPGIKYDVIILDPLYTTVKGSLSSDEVATDWIRSVREIKAIFYNCAVILLHHEGKDIYQEGKLLPRKADSMFGSTFWKAYVNYTYRLYRHGDKHILELGKRRNDKTPDKLELKLVEPFPLKYVYADEDVNVPRLKVISLLGAKPEGASCKEILEACGISKATFYRVIKVLLDEGTIEKMEVNAHIIKYRKKV